MLIVVQHRISDPEAFRARGEHPQPARPDHWRLHHLLPDPSGTRCICLWEADSVEALREYIDSHVGNLSVNDYWIWHETVAPTVEDLREAGWSCRGAS